MKSSRGQQGFHAINRREFALRLTGASAAAMTVLNASSILTAQELGAASVRKAAIIGHTGQGDYGHNLDLVFNDREGIDVVAVADPDEAGRSRAAQRCGAARSYSDWREMLVKEKPQLVCLAPRWSEHRLAMGMAALESGAHIVSEKPFTPTLAEADKLLAKADSTGRKIAVAHQIRLAPSVTRLREALGNGLIGDLLEIRAWGKQDDRAGGEDMIVLGSHLFDLMRIFAGDALYCTARVMTTGRDITRSDARNVTEQIGPVAGDEIEAQFAFGAGVQGSFVSRKRLRESVGQWGMELVGSKGSARILTEVYAAIYLRRTEAWNPKTRTESWERWSEDPGVGLAPGARGSEEGNRRVVDDWLLAIRDNREPACSGRAAMKSLEMIMAVYQAALEGRRVALPLVERGHPLG